MDIFLIIIYVAILSWMIYKWQAFRIEGIPNIYLSLFFILKVIAGISYIEIHRGGINGGDIFLYIADSRVMFETLRSNPVDFMELVFGKNGGDIPAHLHSPITTMGFWDNSSAYFMVRFHALIQFLSFGNIYIHAVFSAFFGFLGLFALAKLFRERMNRNYRAMIVSLFLFPSILFWTSGIHKESLLTFGLGIFCYGIFHLIHLRLSILSVLMILVGGSLVYVLRDFILLLMIPPALGYAISVHWPGKALIKYGAIYLMVIISALAFDFGRELNFLEIIDAKRNDFLSLKMGNTFIELSGYQPEIASLIVNIPKALFNSLFRPLPWEAKGLFQWIAAGETALLGIFLLFAGLKHRFARKDTSMILFLMCYGITLLTAVGLIVPNIGAILRYRVIGLLFIIPMIIYFATYPKTTVR